MTEVTAIPARRDPAHRRELVAAPDRDRPSSTTRASRAEPAPPPPLTRSRARAGNPVQLLAPLASSSSRSPRCSRARPSSRDLGRGVEAYEAVRYFPRSGARAPHPHSGRRYPICASSPSPRRHEHRCSRRFPAGRLRPSPPEASGPARWPWRSRRASVRYAGPRPRAFRLELCPVGPPRASTVPPMTPPSRSISPLGWADRPPPARRGPPLAAPRPASASLFPRPLRSPRARRPAVVTPRHAPRRPPAPAGRRLPLDAAPQWDGPLPDDGYDRWVVSCATAWSGPQRPGRRLALPAAARRAAAPTWRSHAVGRTFAAAGAAARTTWPSRSIRSAT